MRQSPTTSSSKPRVAHASGGSGSRRCLSNRQPAPQRASRACACHALRTGLLVAIAALAGPVAAQVPPPSPGSVLRELQTLPRPIEPPVRPGDPAIAPALPVPSTAEVALRLTVEQVRFVTVGPRGSQPFSDPELEALAAEALKAPVGFIDLQALVLRLSETLRARGLLVARAFLPAQDIRDGVLEIGIVEGRVGRAVLDNQSVVRNGVLDGILEQLLPPGHPIEAGAVERVALLADDLAGVTATRVVLAPGDAVGTSAVTLVAQPTAPWSAVVGADNYGNEFTGIYRFNGSFTWSNPLRAGDALNLLGIVSDGDLWLARMGYRVPWARYGLTFDASYAASNYRLGREFSVLGAGGSTQVTEAGVSYALLRRLAWVSDLGLRYEGLRLTDNPTGATDLLRTIGGVSARLSGTAWPGSANNIGYNLIVRRGRVDIANSEAADFDAATVQTAGNFTRVFAAVNGIQGFGPATLYGNVQTQWASRNLDPAERMTVTGIAGVRAYAPGILAASEGWLANLEARYLLPRAPGQLQAVAFYDAARSRPFTDPLPRQPQASTNLAGAGVGLTWFEASGWQARIYVAWPVGSRPANVDGDSPRYLAQLTRAF